MYFNSRFEVAEGFGWLHGTHHYFKDIHQGAPQSDCKYWMTWVGDEIVVGVGRGCEGTGHFKEGRTCRMQVQL